ncbi:Piwi domain-containing protein [Lentinula aciculospora]|uniref:Piwi domain-containing protein n=1 Tax=Lentinula aciculospora TaxID=153920 RepID=A0A9W9A412_9AGAR|nr:Piwi domain-containing protein [Lentinula aciculospora]
MNPRYGTEGHRIDVDVNAFTLSWAPRSVVMHYDGISIKPNFNGPSGKDIVIGREKGNEILQRLQVNIRPELFPKPGAFDGKKNLYAFRAFNFTSERFEVPWDKEQIQGRKPKTVTVQIVLVRRVDISLLRRVLSGNEQGNPNSIGPGTDVASSLNMLQAFLLAAPKIANGNLHKGKSVYVQWHKGYQQSSDQKKIDDRMRPLRLVDGFNQSARLTMGRIIVNINLSVGVILQEMPLEALCATFLHCNNLRQLIQLCSASGGEFDKLRHFLRDVKVSIRIPGKPSNSKGRRAIRNLIRDVGSHSFDRNGVPATIQEYFLSTHGVRIPPQSIGVVIGNHEIFPISACVVPEQLYKSKLDPDHVREVLSFVPKNPRERLQRIKAGWQNLEYDNSEFLKGADITVQPNALTISGRILPAPQILYKGTAAGPYKLTLTKPGTWDVMKKTFWSAARLSFVLVLNLTGRRHNDEMTSFMDHLFRNLSDRGIAVPKTSLIIDDSGADPSSLIRREAERHEARPAGLLVFAFLPESAAELYANVKRAGDIQLGVPTQCIRWSSKLIQNVRNNRVDQYLNNLALKINARCGGVNHVPSSIAMNYLAEVPTMVIGADVSHPSPGSTAPSFASLVSSRDQQCSKYSAQMKIQPSRQEIIESLDNMMIKAIKIFRSDSDDSKNPKYRLRRIFFFRDGVSEGEFETVRERELNALKRLLVNLYGQDRPKITFIVVGKRHHFRFFPKSGGDADASGNCPSGFVVDQGIEHPVYSDFYLQSQPGLKGTSIPAHYTVIEDENLGGNGDHLQSLAYALCHTYQRCTRSVKLPAPVYYADLVCQRAKFHFQPRFANQLDGFSDAATDDTPESLSQDFRNLHQNLDKTMHFM